MKIAFITSETFPYIKSGGLADVAGTLPKILESLGCEVKLFLPKYNLINEEKHRLKFIDDIIIPIKVAGKTHSVYLHRSTLPGSNVEVNFVDCPYYYSRGKIYTNDDDEDERFILLNKAVLELLQRFNWYPDVIHCNDWQTGLVPLYIKDNYGWDALFRKTATVYTIHNIGYQGQFSDQTFYKADINKKTIQPSVLNESELFSFMKNGILFSDIINTVSETYALEILTQEYGAGMDEMLNERRTDLFGIVNGIDYSEWNPLTDEHIPFHYCTSRIEGKEKTKKYLLEKFNLTYDKNIPVIGIVSRLVSQKGFDILAQSIHNLMQLNAQWIILGSGEDRFEDLFKSLTHSYPHKVASYLGYNNNLSHLIEAGSDMFLMPSRYEPCGLNQLYSLRYGTVPVVRKTGGLADTVMDWHDLLSFGNESGNGFSFNDYSAIALLTTVQRAVETFRDKISWKKIQQNGMIKDLSWEHSAKKYFDLYGRAIEKRKTDQPNLPVM